jgi:2-polyprenyl-3-methyl-5-hydroxy-6-metoxy-1,4-benzoquinol methylase
MTTNYSERQLIEKAYHDEKYRQTADDGRAHHVTRADQRFWDVIGHPTNKTILDFGCGVGWLSVRLAKAGNHVHGIDISESEIEHARELAATSQVSDRTAFHEMAGEHLDFPADSFDMIVGSSILHHTDLDVTLGRIRHVLKPDGTAIFLEPLNQNLFLQVWRKLTPWRRTPTERAFTKEDLESVRKVFPRARFSFYCFTSMFTIGLLLAAPKSRFMALANRRLEDFDEMIVKAFPSLGRFSAVVIMEMRK